ncbi:DUF805 domain-containing protein [Deinococcus phoenicis]|uniref:DUF805 domain-containing protein n=1 Tax=Deinococcus phoenicis TaxID=1476583 RepID=UPI0009DF1254|nr:DUF805 domain-containing protein [Deinococcus phoenicis]
MNAFVRAMSVQYADFRGRTRRRDLAMFLLFYLLSIFLFALIIGLLATLLGWSNQTAELMGNIYFFITMIPILAIFVRRLHDIGRSGWYVLFAFVPVVGIIIYLFWFTKASQLGTNKWGENPKETGPVLPASE